jgi:DNA mismatch endonuclease, patch repair protein
MARIGTKDTAPELKVRAILRELGFRYRIHGREIAGNPDIVNRKRMVAVFVHGCFWHRHSSPTCKLARIPKSRVEFWQTKLEANRLRDLRNQTALHSRGWQVLVIWECQLREPARVIGRIKRFLRDVP